MLYGLYLSAQGAQAQATQLDVVANNLANAGTNGFKRDLALFQSHRTFDNEYGTTQPPSELDDSTGGVTVNETRTDFSQGALQKSGSAFDVALAGPGFLRVAKGDDEFLTRDGRLDRNVNGDLVTQDGGYSVLSAEGTPIRLTPDATGIEIAQDGTISERFPTGELIPLARLGVVTPDSSTALHKVGENLYQADGDTQLAGTETRLMQGFLEASGVNPVLETMRMIEASRGFETNVNMIKSQDESLARLLTASRP